MRYSYSTVHMLCGIIGNTIRGAYRDPIDAGKSRGEAYPQRTFRFGTAADHAADQSKLHVALIGVGMALNI